MLTPPVPHDGTPSALFINLSNHPSTAWAQAQLDAARWAWLGPNIEREQVERTIVDLRFPPVDPGWDIHSLDAAIDIGVGTIITLVPPRPDHLCSETASDAVFWRAANRIVIHIMGEFGLTFGLIQLLRRKEKILHPLL
ncbi:MAG: hypothetical protein ACREM3_31135, partial [Candidatus Rokuibacteriota bacterium]